LEFRRVLFRYTKKNFSMERWIKIAGYISLALMLPAIIPGCKETDMHSPVNGNGGSPSQVKNVSVKNLPGGALISYDLPNEEDLLYVLAKYEIRPGVTREAKSSNYINRLEVNGFGATGDYEVKLYSVGRNEKLSEPVTVQGQPERRPINDAFETIAIKEGFGGMTVTIKNEYEASLAVEVLTPDSLGILATETTFYTSLEDISLPVRGFDPEERLFGVVLRDRWDNFSDT